MKSTLPTVIHVGPHSEAFERIFKPPSGLCEGHFVHVDGEKRLAVELLANPNAVMILDCPNLPDACIAVISDFPDATIVGFTLSKSTARELAMTGVFDVVVGTDPGWRILLTLRNAIERSAFMKLHGCVNSYSEAGERPLQQG